MALLPDRPLPVEHSLSAVGLEPALPPIRRRIDGSIDFNWYIARGRYERGAALQRALTRFGRVVTRAWSTLSTRWAPRAAPAHCAR
jgi:hypothetical protein